MINHSEIDFGGGLTSEELRLVAKSLCTAVQAMALVDAGDRQIQAVTALLTTANREYARQIRAEDKMDGSLRGSQP